MSETSILTLAFLAVGTPLYLAVGVIGADRVRELRQRRLISRHGV